MRSHNLLVLVAVLGLLGYLVYVIGRMGKKAPETGIETYDQLRVAIAKGDQISEIALGEREAKGKTLGGKEFKVAVPGDPELADKLLELVPEGRSLALEIKHRSLLETVLSTVGTLAIPIVLLLVFWFLMMRQVQGTSGQALTFGRSRHRIVGESFEKVTFADVAGMAEVKQELAEVVEFLRDPEKFRELGAKIPRGCLLVGPPGCGKTLLARAIAGEAGVQFFYISGSDFVEMFVGVGASRVRDLFDQAKHQLPAIVFIDEIDAVGRQRGAGLGGGHDEREQTLNALLVEMDGFDPNADVILLAATNRPDILDPALLRPGRFDRRIVVDNPDVKEREAILAYYTEKKPLADDVDLRVLARRTPGFTGADLENMCNEAALFAARQNQKEVDMAAFDEATDRILAGPERKSRVIGEREKRILAYHEAGHALVASKLPDSDPVYKVSILPRGHALGYTIRLPTEDRYLISKRQLLDTIGQVLGGRAAEQIVFDEMTTGAADDLEKATGLSRQMVCEFGMSEAMGPITFGRKHGPVFLARNLMEERNYSEDVAKGIDAEIRNIVDGCYDRATQILQKNREHLDRLVDVLLEREVLDKEEVDAVLAGEELPPLRSAVQEDGAGDEPEEAPQHRQRNEEGPLGWKPAPQTP
ncbi:MAG: ATP-dependent zinc metalloprotease FtsH [Armatimonadota bacterium]